MSVERSQELVEPSHAKLSIVRQCGLLSISRSTWYYEPAPESEATLALMQAIDAVFLDCPRKERFAFCKARVVWQPPNGAPSGPDWP